MPSPRLRHASNENCKLELLTIACNSNPWRRIAEVVLLRLINFGGRTKLGCFNYSQMSFAYRNFSEDKPRWRNW